MTDKKSIIIPDIATERLEQEERAIRLQALSIACRLYTGLGNTDYVFTLADKMVEYIKTGKPYKE